MPAHAPTTPRPHYQAGGPNYWEGHYVIRNYVFRSGETLPELKLHYRTLGTPKRNTAGKIINGVLLLQGNTLRKIYRGDAGGPGGLEWVPYFKKFAALLVLPSPGQNRSSL